MSRSEGTVLDREDFDGIDVRFDAEAASVSAARHALRDWLSTSVGKTGDILLVASELAGNAVRAKATWFRLRAWLEDGVLVIEVADDGPGFDAPLPPLDQVPPLDAENGRGLFLVRTLADRCTIFTSETGTIVRCRITL